MTTSPDWLLGAYLRRHPAACPVTPLAAGDMPRLMPGDAARTPAAAGPRPRRAGAGRGGAAGTPTYRQAVHASPGRYRIEGRAAGFEPSVSAPVYVGAGSTARASLTLRVGPIEQHVVVTAAAADVPAPQTGAPVSVLTSETLTDLGKAGVIEALRLVPGATIVQSGARGGATSVFLRGGASDYNKVLIDGVPANDIGGAFDWDAVGTTGLERVEVLRTANSVVYGSDALSGVISLTTRRGRSRTPRMTYAVDGGNFGTLRNELSVGGAAGRFDYFVDLSRFDTDNELPNNAFRNDTAAARFGALLGGATDLSVTVRRTGTDYGAPGAFLFHGIADDASQTNHLTYAGVTARSSVTNRLQTEVQVASAARSYRYINPAPTGEAFDPFGFGANYLGNAVTITGANGFEATGRAILDFGGVYPSVFAAETTRRLVSGQADVYVSDALDLSAGLRVEREAGTSGASAMTARTNVGSFVEASATPGNRVFVTAGVGLENNDLFGFAVTPRLSAALYLRLPAAVGSGTVGDTKVTVNAGGGIKAPNVFDEQSALFTLLGGLPDGGALIEASGVGSIGPERGRSIDAGVEQAFAGGRVRIRAAVFFNAFEDLIEYVSRSVLPQLGVPGDVAAAAGFGATVNAASFRARGVETSAEVWVGRVRVASSYTFLDAEVTESFSGSALNPAFNPAFPDVPIGQFSPLVGARPFRRPTHSGSLLASYDRGPGQISLAGHFAGRSDDSTFLADPFFGTSLLLPNTSLNGGYQKVDLSGSWRLHPRVRWYASIENLLDQQYQPVAGFPALSRAFRTGASVTLGGD